MTTVDFGVKSDMFNIGIDPQRWAEFRYPEVANWLKNNCRDKWCYVAKHGEVVGEEPFAFRIWTIAVSFNDPNEALMFKLAWGGD